MSVEKKEYRIPRAPFAFLFLRAMYKWEVAHLYGKANLLNYSRYYFESGTITSDLEPSALDDFEEKAIIARARSFTREMIETIENLEFTTSMLDRLATRISILGKYKSWDDFLRALDEDSMLTIRYQKLLNRISKKGYLELEDQDKADIIKAVNDAVLQKGYPHVRDEEKRRHGKKIDDNSYLTTGRYISPTKLNGFLCGIDQLELLHSCILNSKFIRFIEDKSGNIKSIVAVVPLNKSKISSMTTTKRHQKIDISGTQKKEKHDVLYIKYMLFRGAREKKQVINNLLTILGEFVKENNNINTFSAHLSETTLFLKHFGLKHRITNLEDLNYYEGFWSDINTIYTEIFYH